LSRQNHFKKLNGPSTDNIQITFMRPNNKETVVVMPADGALHTYNHTNEEIKFAVSHPSSVVLGISLNGQSASPAISIGGANPSYSMNKESSMFGMAKYGGLWRGSRITKK